MNKQVRALQSVDADNSGGYQVSRLNAVQHGILSKHTVLPWENEDEYGMLLDALVAEHEPGGPTEEHLVEELAGVIWRKRRVRLAERASHQKGLEHATKSYNDTDKIALISLSDAPKEADVRKAVRMTSSEYQETQTDLDEDKAMTVAALEILDAGKPNCYTSALEVLREDTQKAWQDQLTWQPGDYGYGKEPFVPSADSLARFLRTEIMTWYVERSKELAAQPIIREHAFNDSFNPDRMEKLARYEVRLDRKLERTLSMLLKLQDLRAAAASSVK